MEYDMVEALEYVDIPELLESWNDTLFAMELRYPKGIMLHAPTKAKAELLRSTALNAAKIYAVTLQTSVRRGDDDWLVYIAQL